MVRNSFVFYGSFFEAIKELEDKDKGIISYAIMQYGLTGETPNLRGYLKSMFLLIKPQIDANNERYENGCKGGEYGKLGGRPKSKKSVDKERKNWTEGELNNPIETPTKPLNNPTQTPNEDVDEDVDVDVNENEDVDVNGNGDYKGKNQKVSDPKDQNNQNDKTDFSFGERPETTNDTANDQMANGFPLRENQKANDKATGISTPLQATSPPAENSLALARPEVISSTCVETFKARVEYAKSLGIEEGVAVRICNFAQSYKIPLSETHYRGFVGKGKKEIEEAFNLLKFLAKRGKSSKCQGHNGLKHINSS
jgi:hypothetical protein